MYTPLETSNHNTLDFLVYVVKYIVSRFARRILSAVIIQRSTFRVLSNPHSGFPDGHYEMNVVSPKARNMRTVVGQGWRLSSARQSRSALPQIESSTHTAKPGA